MKYMWIFLYSCMLSLMTGLCSYGMTLKWFSIAEMLRSCAVGATLFGILLLVPARMAGWILRVCFVPLLLLTCASVLHILVYKSPISAFAVQSTLETSPNEAAEFLSEFVTPSSVLAITLVTGLACFLLFRAVRANRQLCRNRLTALAALLVLFLCGYSITAKGGRLLESNSAYVIVSATLNHQRDMASVNALKTGRRQQDYGEVSLLDTSHDLPRTYVFIIGESANRNHMSLYNTYHRKTTPRLEELGDEITVFTDAVSASTHTIPSLRQSLLFHSGTEEADILEAKSLVGLLGKAGFSTWWLSNQTANSEGLTGTAILAGDARHQQFFNRSRSEGHSVSYDEVLLPALDKVLQRPERNKAVFLHLIGSHLSYHLRYPGEYNVFRSTGDIPDAPWRPEKHKKYINQYDNSILYTDHVVSSVIKRLQEHGGASFVVYFSDHGQEVYDTRPIRGQDAKNPSRHMFDIPFLLWFSPAYAAINPDIVTESRHKKHTAFSLRDFSHTAAGLARIRFSELLPQHNVFSEQYTPRIRTVSGGFRYDDLSPVHGPRLGLQGRVSPLEQTRFQE